MAFEKVQRDFYQVYGNESDGSVGAETAILAGVNPVEP